MNDHFLGESDHFNIIESTRKILTWVRPLPLLAMPRFRKRLFLQLLPYLKWEKWINSLNVQTQFEGFKEKLMRCGAGKSFAPQKLSFLSNNLLWAIIISKKLFSERRKMKASCKYISHSHIMPVWVLLLLRHTQSQVPKGVYFVSVHKNMRTGNAKKLSVDLLDTAFQHREGCAKVHSGVAGILWDQLF